MMTGKERQEPVVLVDQSNDSEDFIKPAILDGANKRLLEENRLNGDPENGVSPMSKETVDNIFKNSFKAIGLFASPNHEKENNVSKILAIGRVQSGKTGFFISTISLAFDNGYRLAFLVGGTKNPLREQNFERVCQEFKNNDDIVVLNFNYAEMADIENHLNSGKRVVLVVLKNPSENKNLGALLSIANFFREIPTLIIDDEGDEYSPGAPQSKAKDNRTHSILSEIVYTPRTCTFLSVTATPQANLLISTPDPLSPDYCVLVEPGKGYIGGIDFHDTMKNVHVEIVNDSGDFKTTIPKSFESALRYFFIACCIKVAQGDTKDFSMLVNPSSFTIVHADIVHKIIAKIHTITALLVPDNPGYSDEISTIETEFNHYKKANPESTITFDEAIEYLPSVIERVSTYEFNATSGGKADQQRAKEEDDKKYKIFVGGSMLGRGLTIKRLIVTYIYNDSKKSAIDTLYQRARWLGYKSSYFDVCKIYLTYELQQKFIDIVESEIDMWNSISSFLYTRINLKQWPRIFTLNNDKLMLTRTTVSHTVQIERMNPGYTYDKTIWLTAEQRVSNRMLANKYMETHTEGYEFAFSASSTQVGFVIPTKITEFYECFISSYSYPRGATLGPNVFKRIYEQAKSGDLPDEITVIYMRYKRGEFRQGINDDRGIAELPQGKDAGTGYSGDRSLDEFANQLHVQIHMVYTKKEQTLADAFPILALNNPISPKMIQLVTGDNVYESI